MENCILDRKKICQQIPVVTKPEQCNKQLIGMHARITMFQAFQNKQIGDIPLLFCAVTYGLIFLAMHILNIYIIYTKQLLPLY